MQTSFLKDEDNLKLVLVCNPSLKKQSDVNASPEDPVANENQIKSKQKTSQLNRIPTMKNLYVKIILLLLLLLWWQHTSAQTDKVYTQTIRGKVLDKGLQHPVEGAVVIVSGTEPALTAVTDSTGVYEIKNVPVGRYDIKISSTGYKDAVIPNVIVNSGKETLLDLEVEEDISQQLRYTAKGERDKFKSGNALIDGSVNVLRPADINRFAGSRSDPSRMAANYAGVAGGGDQRNDIIVRGNSPLGVLWRLEGVDIQNPNHFTFMANSGGAFSILNNNLLANTDFLTGAFPAEYGNKTAAVFDVRMREGNNQKRENTFQIGLNGLEYTTEGPFSKKSKASYLLSYRFFSFGILDALGVSIGANGIPQYHDATFKVNVPTVKAGTFTVWGIGGTSTIKLTDPVIEPDSIENPQIKEQDDFASSMFAAGASNTHTIGEKTKGKITIAATGSKVRVYSKATYEDESSIEDYKLTNVEGHYLINYTLTHKFDAQHLVKAGVTYRNIFFNNNEKYYDDDDSAYYIGLNQKGNAGLLQTYAHWNFRVTEQLTLNSGLYYQYFMMNNKHAVEPRLSASYQISQKHKVSLASGLHSQTLPLFIYQYQYHNDTKGYYSPNKDLGFMRSAHVVLGYQYSVNKNMRAKAEAYYQYMYQVPVGMASDRFSRIYSVMNTGASYGYDLGDSIANNGKGVNYGLELTLERSFSNNYYFLTNVSLFRSQYAAADGSWRSTAFDLGRVCNVLAGREFHLDKENRRTLSFDIRLNYSGGRRIIPVDVEKSLESGHAEYDFEHAYSQKVKDYFRTDVKITYNINRPKATHNFFIAADNVLNTKNVLTQDWDNVKEEVVTEYQLGIFPYLGYRVQF